MYVYLYIYSIRHESYNDFCTQKAHEKVFRRGITVYGSHCGAQK